MSIIDVLYYNVDENCDASLRGVIMTSTCTTYLVVDTSRVDLFIIQWCTAIVLYLHEEVIIRDAVDHFNSCWWPSDHTFPAGFSATTNTPAIVDFFLIPILTFILITCSYRVNIGQQNSVKSIDKNVSIQCQNGRRIFIVRNNHTKISKRFTTVCRKSNMLIQSTHTTLDGK